jgi:hypothetical protein
MAQTWFLALPYLQTQRQADGQIIAGAMAPVRNETSPAVRAGLHDGISHGAERETGRIGDHQVSHDRFAFPVEAGSLR